MKISRALLGSVGCAVVLSAACAVPAFAEEGVTTMATSAPLNMRSAADVNSSVVTVIPQGTSVQVYGMTSDGWYDVEYNNQRGNCWFQYLDFEGQGDGTVHDGHITDMYATAPLNVRSAPNTNSNILGSLTEGQPVAVTAKHDGWFTVVFNGQTGYCYGQWLGFGQDHQCQVALKNDAPASGSSMNTLTAAAPLNVRAEPNTSSTILGSYKQGEQVKVLASVEDGAWDQVQFGNQTGYVSTAWLQ